MQPIIEARALETKAKEAAQDKNFKLAIVLDGCVECFIDSMLVKRCQTCMELHEYAEVEEGGCSKCSEEFEGLVEARESAWASRND